MSAFFGVTAAQRKLLREILATAGDHIIRVTVFGASAIVRCRPILA